MQREVPRIWVTRGKGAGTEILALRYRRALPALPSPSAGRAGVIRFLAQFENRDGDYTKDRQEWVDRTSFAEIQESSRRRKRKHKL